MMEEIVYEDEFVREEVYKGVVPLDSYMTEERQRKEIFEMMRRDGITVENEDEYTIGFEGASDDDGISESQSSEFVVFHEYTKKVPYKVVRDKVYEGVYVLDSIRISPEEQRNKIFEMMRNDGITVENEDELEIGYEGASDDDGISETQSTKFVVYRVRKEKINDDKFKIDDTLEPEEQLESVYLELKQLRERVLSTTDAGEIARLSERMAEISDLLDQVLSDANRSYEPMEQELERIQEEILEVQGVISKLSESYVDIYNKIKALLTEEAKVYGKVELSEEELNKKMEEFLQQRGEDNDTLNAINQRIEVEKERLEKLQKKQKKVKKDLDISKALGLSAAEYEEIVSVLRKRNLITAILEEKGLGHVISIPAKNRTAEQKRQLREARRVILEEIAALKKDRADKSVLDLVEILYGVETEVVQLKGKQRVLVVRPNSLENIRKNVSQLPAKIIKANDILPTYEPGDIPKDMVEVMKMRKQQENASRGFDDRYSIYTFGDRTYVRVGTLERFNIDPIGDEVQIDGAAAYEIAKDDADFIRRNANNGYSPYTVEELELEREDVVGLQEKHTIFTDGEKIYVRKPALERFNIEPIGDEVRIDGVASYEISKEDADFIRGNANNNYSPYVVEEVEIEKENTDGLQERHTIFTDGEKIYVRKPALERFNIEPIGDEVRIDEVASYEISKEDADFIRGNANNNYSPYVVEEVEIEKENTDGLQEKHTIFTDGEKIYVRKPALERFNIEPIGDEVRIDGVASYEISKEDADFIRGNANNNYSPYVVEDVEIEKDEEKQEEQPGEKYGEENETTELKDKISLYRDQDGEYYVYSPVVERFNLEPTGDEVRIKNILSYPIAKEDADYIRGNANNSYSPYIVVEEDVQVDKNVVEEERESTELKDKISLYRDQDGIYYVYRPVLDRFNLDPDGDAVRIKNILSYPITKEDADYIRGNANNSYSPYIVVEEDIQVERVEQIPIKPLKPEEELAVRRGLIDKITIYRDTIDPTICYIRKPALERFNKDATGDEIRIDGVICYPISSEDAQTIINNANNNYSPYVVDVRPVDVSRKSKNVTPVLPPNKEDPTPEKNNPISQNPEPKKPDPVPAKPESKKTDPVTPKPEPKQPEPGPKKNEPKKTPVNDFKARPHVEAVIDKLTRGLDIRARDGKRYQASNVKVSKAFSDELRSGNYLYNIVHVVPATLKAGAGFFTKLVSGLLITGRGRDAMKELEDRLDKLSDEELEVLFEEYRGSQLKTDMNNQINPIILARLRKYGLAKVEKLNSQIKESYALLFTKLGQVKVLEERMVADGVTDDEVDSLKAQRDALVTTAAEDVMVILKARKEANKLLSGGIHGLEEDFKAVATKLNYVGLRFGKNNDFDNELQKKLGELGSALNGAIAIGDAEGIVQNFMGLETCYYDNTSIKGSFVGKRSVGAKYYSPIAEQFDYRDDPFMRDLLTTVAVTSAAVSTINAIRVHQVEAQRIIDEQNTEAATANAQNSATMDYVHRTSKAITDKRDTFREGMEAQAEQDILTNAASRERAHLDSTGWQFSGAYHAADNAGHAAYNQFNADVTSRINDVTSSYAQGLITQAQALEKMATISNDAQATLQSVVSSSLDILRNYAATHPKFDLTAFEQSMSYIVAHPDSIINMNNAVIDTVNLAGGLANLEATPFTALASLPSDIASTIVCAATAAVLAMNVSATLNKNARRKSGYGNEITDMMEEYVISEEENSTGAKTR